MPNYYEILGVQPNASDVDIKKAYRTLSLKYHPDRNSDPDASSKFQEINNAYEVLSDPDKRKQFDIGASDISEEFSFPNAFHFPGGGVHFAHMHSMPHPEMQHIFESFFGGLGGPNVRVFHNENMFKPVAIDKTINLTLEQVYNGEKVNIILERRHFDHNQHEYIEVNIPKGIQNGEVITLAGIGHKGPGNSYGDVRLTIQVEEHGTFTRKNNDLCCKQKITLKEALCGFTIEILHVSGKMLRINNLNNKCVVYPGYVKEVENYGLIQGSVTGKLLIEFEIVFPEGLSNEQIESLNNIL
jgi:DnaJ-class molecular chaperone